MGRGLQGFREDSSLFVTITILRLLLVVPQVSFRHELKKKKKLKPTIQYRLIYCED